ncbi:ornithine cyclodeaminase family protein [Sphingomonas sp. JC676]|uniref:ornithine cyclodeaminase family protein n=1 Tax=Sphingomonas sp. JC676 TaxID=2768065 RepID=UPI0016578A15|nr:ornithine cyclodeaminase family protein [Sphingomonas sp. JC676]MBC9033751.1 ornithine cyclodeaminase family protein [Sphingomonas sp. JC676]
MGPARAPVVIDAPATARALAFPELVTVLRGAFAAGATVPERHHHYVPVEGRTPGVLLVMPAWREGGYLGVKLANIFPGNTTLGLPSVHAGYLLFDASTGAPLAMIDGNEITARRTVAVSALAASYLAREDARSLLIVGAGRLAGLAAHAFRAVRPIDRVAVWNVRPDRAIALAATLREQGIEAVQAPSLEQAVGEADIVTCATLSADPLIRGEWLRPGAHVDLIGSFTPAMREADDACFARARVFVDSERGFEESGDLIGPLASGAIPGPESVGTLAGLCGGLLAGRRTDEEITLFKAVGTALADLAAAGLVFESTERSA